MTRPQEPTIFVCLAEPGAGFRCGTTTRAP